MRKNNPPKELSRLEKASDLICFFRAWHSPKNRCHLFVGIHRNKRIFTPQNKHIPKINYSLKCYVYENQNSLLTLSPDRNT